MVEEEVASVVEVEVVSGVPLVVGTPVVVGGSEVASVPVVVAVPEEELDELPLPSTVSSPHASGPAPHRHAAMAPMCCWCRN